MEIITYCVFVQLFVSSFGQRRISGGKEVVGDRQFMVYFVKAKTLNQENHGWTCGGTLITTQHILTSAACISEVGLIYAIAGYRRYVPTDLLDVDECTSTKKKRVMKTCVPKPYEIGYSDIPSWANYNDIGIAIVESPYNFTDSSYYVDCSYTPRPIAVNFRLKTQAPGKDVVALGWGHARSLRLPFHVMDHNEEFLREASTLIVDNKVCAQKFNTTSLQVHIGYFDKFICTNGSGNIDSEGNIIDYGELVNDCVVQPALRRGQERDSKRSGIKGFTPNPHVEPIPNYGIEKNAGSYEESSELTRKSGRMEKIRTKRDALSQYERLNEQKLLKCRRLLQEISYNTRRQSICQNDHGSPLITWIGTEEVVIGIAMTSLYNQEYHCVPPNLYVSTVFHPWFIKCGISKYVSVDGEDPKVERCLDRPDNEEYDIHENVLDWSKEKKQD